jgi:hypothetical protein
MNVHCFKRSEYYVVLYTIRKWQKKPLTFSQDIFHNSIERIMINVQIISFEEKNKSWHLLENQFY